eukprot:3327446-Amphidinium_carterae.1
MAQHRASTVLTRPGEVSTTQGEIADTHGRHHNQFASSGGMHINCHSRRDISRSPPPTTETHGVKV